MKYVVKVIENATGECFEEIEADGKDDADLVAEAVSINLNHAEFSVRVCKVGG